MIKQYIKKSEPVFAVEFDGSKKSIEAIKQLAKKDKTFSVELIPEDKKRNLKEAMAVTVKKGDRRWTSYAYHGQYVIIDKTEDPNFFVTPKEYFTENYQSIKL